MNLFQALLLALWAGYCSYDDQGPQMLRRPLLIGPIAGIILGDVTSGLIVSATLELMWMGLGNMAGYKTPDMIIGTIVGITVSIQTGTGTSPEGIAAGVAAATTVAVLAQQLLLVFEFIKQTFAPWADRLALTGNFNSILQINVMAILFQMAVKMIPTNILSGLSVASGLLPAIGLSILMTMMMKGFFWPFLLFGFALATYLELNILSITLISLAFAMIYSLIMEVKDRQNEMPKVINYNDEEGEYDL